MEQLEQIQEQVAQMKAQLDGLSKKTAENKISMVVFSGDLDRALAAFVIATGARAMGVPGCPLLAACTPSIERVRIVLIACSSISFLAIILPECPEEKEIPLGWGQGVHS